MALLKAFCAFLPGKRLARCTPCLQKSRDPRSDAISDCDLFRSVRNSGGTSVFDRDIASSQLLFVVASELYRCLLSKLQAQLQPKSLLQREVTVSFDRRPGDSRRHRTNCGKLKQFEFDFAAGASHRLHDRYAAGLALPPTITLEDTRPTPAHAFQSEKIIRRLWTFGLGCWLWLLLRSYCR